MSQDQIRKELSEAARESRTVTEQLQQVRQSARAQERKLLRPQPDSTRPPRVAVPTPTALRDDG